jgi:acetyl esterase/lipase
MEPFAAEQASSDSSSSRETLRVLPGRDPAGGAWSPVAVSGLGPSRAARMLALASRLTVRPALTVGSRVPHLPWPWSMIDFAARALPSAPGTSAMTITLPTATARVVRAAGVRPADGNRRVVLYLHGGAFVACGPNSHSRLVHALSKFADAPVLVANYRLLPKHSVAMALDDCYDAYRWLRDRGYRPEQIVVVGDSAGGYLAMSLVQRLQREDGEVPAALVGISPLLQLAAGPKQAHSNMRTDAIFPPNAMDALVALITRAARADATGRAAAPLYEPLDHVEPGLPQTLIHVSGSEVLLHDAQLAVQKLVLAGVPAQVRVWPGQVHDFQVVAPLVPEAVRSLREIGDYIRWATPAAVRTPNRPQGHKSRSADPGQRETLSLAT